MQWLKNREEKKAIRLLWKELEKSSGIILFIDSTRGYCIIYDKIGITEEMEKFKAMIAREYMYSEVLSMDKK
jgi:hypothetical protein